MISSSRSNNSDKTTANSRGAGLTVPRWSKSEVSKWYITIFLMLFQPPILTNLHVLSIRGCYCLVQNAVRAKAEAPDLLMMHSHGKGHADIETS